MTTSVDIQGMQLAQQDFQLALDQLNSVYSAMTEEQDTLSANWSGMAASAFGQALGAWLDDLYQIRQELVVMTESLSTHTGIYSDANEASQQVVAAFQQGLGGLEELPTEPVTLTRRRAVEGRLLPEMAVRERDANLEPFETGVRMRDEVRMREGVRMRDGVRMKAVEDTPGEVLPSDTERTFVKSERPVLPTLLERNQEPLLSRLEEPEQPLLPRDVEPEHPLLPPLLEREQPALPTLPFERVREEEPLLPTLLDLPESRTS